MTQPLAFYNEIDPHAAQWLRNLIDAGHIPAGVVDERSIADIAPEELHGFTQCHFFAGIGGWPLALRRVGWPDDRPVWTGSCPCQPFSAAGAGAGFDDERHLWPAFFHHIEQLHPPVVFGEQVASKAVDEWIDLVQADLEAVGYAVGAVPFPSAGVGAPHIRDRLYWAAVAGAMVHAERAGLEGHRGHGDHRHQPGWLGALTAGPAGTAGATGGLADAPHGGFQARIGAGGSASSERRGGTDAERCSSAGGPGPVNGLWRAADWLLCRDGRWRPVEPGTFPLAHGVPARVGRLRAYGNAINVEAAVAFIEAYEAARRERSGLIVLGAEDLV